MKTLSRSGVTFASIAVLLVISLAIMFLVGQLIIDANAKLLASQALLDRLTDTLSIVKDAETGQRGFLITGNDAYLVPYRQAQSELAEQLNALRDDARHANLEQKSIDDLSQVIGKKMTELEKTIDVRRSAGLDAARAMVNTHLGKSYMEDIRVRVLGLADHARNTVRRQSARSTQWEWVRTIAFTVITAVDLLFIVWSYRRLRAESAAKEAAALDVLRQKNLLGVTLSSIGDAVIVTDTSATIVFMNKVAEALTGWTDGSANGQPCDEVFRIINEHSRQAVESPVDKVLKTGHTVGLANHTLLIRKDGSELPIDDSGAPVRDASGNVHGVVLIFRDFTHQREASNKLINAMRDLEAANKAKDRFVAMISHELRTPLTPVLGTLTAWEMSDTLSPDLRDEVRMLRWNVELEARLIDDLLDLTRLNAGKLSLKLETADVHQYVRSVLTIFQREIDEKQLKIDLSLAAVEHFVRCDTARLQQVIWNILKNSAKFTAKGGLIRVSTENEDGRLVLKVADNGIGMTAETLARIFRPFEQGNPHITQHFGGLGLGLTISKELTEAHHGTLQATSEGLGKGATFVVTLPTVETPVPTPPSSAPAGSPQPASSKRLNVLLVEDHADTATVISLLLKKFGHTTDTAASVADGIARFQEKSYDILLSDLGLPDGTGLDLIRKVREQSKIPAVALTGYGMDEDVARCKEAGFDAHLTKPLNFQELDALIRQLT